jgi:hypothetical protein
MLGTHFTMQDGREAAKGLRNEISRRKVAVVALENEGSTDRENWIIMQEIENNRRIFDEWRRRTPHTEEEARQKAEEILGRLRNPFMPPSRRKRLCTTYLCDLSKILIPHSHNEYGNWVWLATRNLI